MCFVKGVALKAQTNQTDITELVETKAVKVKCCVASCRLCHSQKSALKHAAKTTANSQLAHTKKILSVSYNKFA